MSIHLAVHLAVHLDLAHETLLITSTPAIPQPDFAVCCPLDSFL